MLAGFADSRQPGHVAVKGRLTIGNIVSFP
jgi:hypothetical protein